MAAPAKPTPDDLLTKAYFRSIGDVFQETLREKADLHWTNFGTIIFAVFMFLTYLTVVPRLLAFAARRALHRDTVIILHEVFRLHKWNDYVSGCIVLGFLGLTLFMYLDWRRERKVFARLLSESQFGFACCYGIVQELDHFRTNHIPRHIETALRYWKHLQRHLDKWFVVRTVPDKFYWRLLMGPAATRKVSVLEKIDELESSFTWFGLEPNTEKVLLALTMVRSRTKDRIQDKKELATVTDFLADLAWYLYTRIPETSSGNETETKELQELGIEKVLAFSQKVIALNPYKSQEVPATNAPGAVKQAASAMYSATYVFSHENMFVCFVAWLLFFAVLVTAGLLLAFHYVPGLKVDSTIVSLGISAPLLASAAAVAVSRRRTDR